MEVKTHICKRCGYGKMPDVWLSRLLNGSIPKQCPKCHSVLWNKPRRKKKKRSAK